ncbi:MAG: hypothetical protein CVU72_00260 [Deltaproteobacteria bacterium HGW-Deltaproteobacteria-7]|nr:MAG: hypothetical protein CVU72_00260 [Deltaproteobacteria bacterium HGW-Deltaproteobacteria-7]PKN20234.1 MAG: hypothetical protein CVU71_00085 [Deltaproteobacteria bacterium HGW-Deltaproteobacteria-6]
MVKIKKLPLLIIAVLGCFAVLLTLSGSVTTAYGQETLRVVPSLGSGPYDVLMFSDYFCPPCKRIDAKAEPLFKELLSTGKVRITFIDVPFSRATPLYARYYLYAAGANGGANNILSVRRKLFEAAQVSRIQTEEALLGYLQREKIALKMLDEKKIFPLMNALIKENKIDETPTCVITYSATDMRKFAGADEIWVGLNALKAHLGKVKK